MGSEPVIEVALDEGTMRQEQVASAVQSLHDQPPTIEPVWFYDKAGSDLFDDITRLPEYYLTRAERSLLVEHAREIAELGATALIELGSGTSEKTRVLLEAMTNEGSLDLYVPVDVSEQTLRDAVASLATEFPAVRFHGIVDDFHGCFHRFPASDRRLIAFLGSTIGNLDPQQRSRFFFDLECAITRDDILLIGFDLVKDSERLLAAYNDGAGVTAAFNRNALNVLNAHVGTDFAPEQFEHEAVWDETGHRIEMHLRANSDVTVTFPNEVEPVFFPEGKSLRTEISSKFTVEGMTEELLARNFIVDQVWISEGDEFALLLAHPYC